MSDSVLVPMNSGINNFACVHLSCVHPCPWEMCVPGYKGICLVTPTFTCTLLYRAFFHVWSGRGCGCGHTCACELICGMRVDSKHVVLSADMHADTLRVRVCMQTSYLCIHINMYRMCVRSVCNGHIQAINLQMWYACE